VVDERGDVHPCEAEVRAARLDLLGGLAQAMAVPRRAVVLGSGRGTSTPLDVRRFISDW
jgi:hypothetical protein